MEIRKIKKADDRPLAAIIRQSLETAKLAIPGTAYFDPELEQLSSYYHQTTRREYFVLVEGEEILGGVGLAEFDDASNTAELQKLYLTPDAQGRGASRLLMQTVLAFAASAGYTKVYLETHHSLISAIALYEKYDFYLLPKPLLPTPHNAMDRFYLKDL